MLRRVLHACVCVCCSLSSDKLSHVPTWTLHSVDSQESGKGQKGGYSETNNKVENN